MTYYKTLICPARAGMIANIKIGTELSGRKLELAACGKIAKPDGEQNEQAPGREKERRNPSPASNPQQDRDRQNQCILACQRQQAQDYAGSHRAARRHTRRRYEQSQQGRGEKGDQRRFVDQTVEEDRRRIESKSKPGQRATAAEERDACRGEQRARTGSNHRLDEPHGSGTVIEYPVKYREEVRIKGRLVEDSFPSQSPFAIRRAH